MKNAMNKLDFAHLHLHGIYSQLDGMGQYKDYVAKAKEFGFKYLACTEHGNIDGLIRFQKACKEQGIIPLLGCEGYIVKEWDKESPRGHICLWIKNLKGFKNLCKILTAANLEGFYYKPRIDFKTLLKYHEDLVIGTACILSFAKVCQDGLKFFQDLHDIKKNDLYCEIMPHNTEEQIEHNQFITKLAKKNDIKIIGTNDCHYVNRKDWKAHEVLLAMQTKSKWNDPKRWKFNIKGYHLRSTDEMITELERIGFYKKEYLTNTIEIAEKCSDFTISKQDIELPHVPGIKSEDENKTLWNLCTEGYRNKFHRSISHNSIYHDRLKFEYDVIKEKNFTRYFLIIHELTSWCHKHEIPIGPRGSVAGSLIAFLIDVTGVDPIKHNLIFDRFINRDRIDYPDIDIDFPDNKRHLIKGHLEEIYGKENIAGVSSFSRLKPRAAIQNVARVFDIAPSETNQFTKLIDEKQDDCIDLTINEFIDAEDYARRYPKVIKYAKALQGTISNYGKHAAALIVSIEDIGKTGRCYLMERNKTRLINWEKDDAEYVGLMKLDALGLSQLTIVDETLRLIKANHDTKVKLSVLDLEDKVILKNINDGNTIGVFQFNTWAMTRLVKEMGIEEFQHMSDAVALVRPGPYSSGMTEEYISRKHTGKWERKNDVYEDITKDTYGIICYQEQIMSVINKVAGLPYSTADTIRKIISKKRDKKEFEQYYKQFLDGCRKERLFSKQEAKEFWDALQSHARYSFNKAHSVSYALVAYWTAFLKHYYPTEYISASLTYGADNKKSELIEEAYRLGLTLRLPKVGISNPIKWVAKNHNLYVPFREVKGLGDKKSVEASQLPKGAKSEGIRRWSGSKHDKTLVKHKGKLGELLTSIGAYSKDDIDINDTVKSLFDFRIVLNPKSNYPKLYELFDYNIKLEELDNALNGENEALKRLNKKLIVKSSFEASPQASYAKEEFSGLSRCNQCSLIDECTRPVMPSKGKYNIIISGEAPGKQEDKYGRGFHEDAQAGKLLWGKINKKGYNREQFHVTNVCKCWPSRSKTPNAKQIEACTKAWYGKEIVQIKPIIILAFGNTNRQFFEEKNSGITSISGKTTWNENYGCWVCWCVHPASVLHNPDNKMYFKLGMKNFFRMLKLLGLKSNKK